MNTNAVYTIFEDGKDFYFYSKYTGGFSCPFEVSGYLNSLKYALQKSRFKEQDICVTPLLSQMKGTNCFPAALKNTLLFREMTRKTAMKTKAVNHIPFFITLDINQSSITFHFGEQFKELRDSPDITFLLYEPKNKYSGGRFMDEALSRHATNSAKTFAEIYELTCKELICQAIAEQRQTLAALRKLHETPCKRIANC